MTDSGGKVTRWIGEESHFPSWRSLTGVATPNFDNSSAIKMKFELNIQLKSFIEYWLWINKLLIIINIINFNKESHNIQYQFYR